MKMIEVISLIVSILTFGLVEIIDVLPESEVRFFDSSSPHDLPSNLNVNDYDWYLGDYAIQFTPFDEYDDYLTVEVVSGTYIRISHYGQNTVTYGLTGSYYSDNGFWQAYNYEFYGYYGIDTYEVVMYRPETIVQNDLHISDLIIVLASGAVWALSIWIVKKGLFM
jgi:hypothetical protein